MAHKRPLFLDIIAIIALLVVGALVWSVFRPTMARGSYIYAKNSKTDTRIYKVVDGTETELFSIDKPAGDTYDSVVGSLSADKQYLYFTNYIGDLMRYNMATDQIETLRQASPYVEGMAVGEVRGYYNPVLSPDGKFLSVEWRGWESRGIDILNPDGTDYLETKTERYNPLFNADQISWSPDGKQFVLSAPFSEFGGFPAKLYAAAVADPTAGKALVPADIQLGGEEATPKNVYDASWSPDGKKIAFAYAYKYTGNIGQEDEQSFRNLTEIFIVNPDGTDLRQITHQDKEARTPLWLDTDTLIYSISKTDETASINQTATLTTKQQSSTLLKEGYERYAIKSLSPDKEKIVYEAWNGSGYSTNRGLYILDLKTRKKQRLGNVGEGNDLVSFVGWLN